MGRKCNWIGSRTSNTDHSFQRWRQTRETTPAMTRKSNQRFLPTKSTAKINVCNSSFYVMSCNPNSQCTFHQCSLGQRSDRSLESRSLPGRRISKTILGRVIFCNIVPQIQGSLHQASMAARYNDLVEECMSFCLPCLLVRTPVCLPLSQLGSRMWTQFGGGKHDG
jgi:hypothetical protein